MDSSLETGMLTGRICVLSPKNCFLFHIDIDREVMRILLTMLEFYADTNLKNEFNMTNRL